jgi:hypothetical protein
MKPRKKEKIGKERKGKKKKKRTKGISRVRWWTIKQ